MYWWSMVTVFNYVVIVHIYTYIRVRKINPPQQFQNVYNPAQTINCSMTIDVTWIIGLYLICLVMGKMFFEQQ